MRFAALLLVVLTSIPAYAAETCYELSATGRWSRSDELLCVASGEGKDHVLTLRSGATEIAAMHLKLLQRVRCIDCNKDVFGVESGAGSSFEPFAVRFDGKRAIVNAPPSDGKPGTASMRESGTVTIAGTRYRYRSAAPAPEPPAPATGLAPIPSEGSTARAKLVVDTVRPSKAEPHVFVVKGHTSGGVRGGFTWNTAAEVRESMEGGQVRLTIEATAPANSVWTRDLPAFEIEVPVPELSRKTGRYEVRVVDPDGKVLATSEWISP